LAEIEIDTLGEELRKAQVSPGKIPSKSNVSEFCRSLPEYAENLMKMVEKAVSAS